MCLSGSLSTIQHLVGGGSVLAPQAQECLERRHWGPTPVEPERELVEIGLEVLVVDPMMRPAQPRLEVAEDPVDPRQDLVRPLARPLGARAMAVAQARHSYGSPFMLPQYSPYICAAL